MAETGSNSDTFRKGTTPKVLPPLVQEMDRVFTRVRRAGGYDALNRETAPTSVTVVEAFAQGALNANVAPGCQIPSLPPPPSLPLFMILVIE
jgi:hypothetical protein